MAEKSVAKALATGAVTVGAAGLLAGIGTAVAGRALWRSLTSTSSLNGKVVLITGSSRGLGLALATECANQGCRLAICARDQPTLQDAERELRRLGAEVFAMPCDITERSAVETLVNEVVARFGRIDVLINNAGTIAVGPLASLTPEDFEEAMDTMFWGMLHTTLLVLPHMQARGEGHIANVTSIGGRMAVPHLLAYSAAKFAATGFSEGLTAEVASQGIKVLTIIPGLMRTGSHHNAFFKGNNRAEYAWFGVSASAPLLAMGARRAAKRIVVAIRRGETELTLGMPAKLAALAHGIAPATTVRALSVVNRLLPGAPEAGKRRHRGHQSESIATRSPLTALGRKAAREWNQQKLA